MDQRSFKEKRSPSKNSGTPKQRFKASSFANEEKHPASPLAQSLSLAQSQHDASASGKLRIPRSTERSHSRKSESSVAGVSVFQDEDPLFSNPKGGAISQKETAHGHSAGILPPRSRTSRPSVGDDGSGTNNGKGGENSPDSGSMISDDVPSGYNSGEQYDTLSAGYMSDMAGRITDTDTRMDWREPSLDVIEESKDFVGAGVAGNTGGISKKSSDEEEEDGELFLVPPPPPVTANPAITGMMGMGYMGLGTASGDMHDRMIEYDRASSTSSSDDHEMLDTAIEMGEKTGCMRPGGSNPGGAQGVGAHHTSPINYAGTKTKPKKKVTTFAIPIEASPLSSGNGFPRNDSFADNAYMDESSDANFGIGAGGMHLSVGGYRTVPSDTDTTDAIESDGCAIATETGTDSGTDNPNSGAHRPLVKSSKKSRKELRQFKRKMENHDDEWFAANDNKYWVATRFICFWASIISMIAATVAAGIFIAYMPRDCNPKIEWYHGTVTLDITPTIHAENSWNIDVELLSNRLAYYHSVGIQTLHLRDFSRKNLPKRIQDKNNDLNELYYPTRRIISLSEKMINGVAKSNANPASSNHTLKELASSLHRNNMTLMVQIPIVGVSNESEKGVISLDLQQDVSKAIAYFMQQGADGIFLDGLEHFGSDRWAAEKVKIWRDMLDQYGVTNNSRILMTSYKFAKNLEKANNAKADEALKHISLLDATLSLETSTNEDTEQDVALFNKTSESLNDIVMWDSVKGKPWINWNLDTESIPLSNAALALQMLLPGTINIGGLEKNPPLSDLQLLEHVAINNHSAAGDQFHNLTRLRALHVPIYMNGNYKRCNCPEEENGYAKEKNFVMNQPAGMQDVIQLERFYSRRNRLVLVANFGSIDMDLAPIGRIYSGGELVIDTSNNLTHLLNTDVKFKSITLLSKEAIVMKLPK